MQVLIENSSHLVLQYEFLFTARCKLGPILFAACRKNKQVLHVHVGDKIKITQISNYFQEFVVVSDLANNFIPSVFNKEFKCIGT